MQLRFTSVRYLLARQAAALAVLIAIALPLGCMAFRFNNDDSDLVQEGEVTVQPHQEVEVYFATPYAGVPELLSSGYCTVIEVGNNHFRVRNNGGAAHKLTWRARGAAGVIPSWQHGNRVQLPPPIPEPDVVPGATQESSPPPVTIGAPR